MKLTNPQLAWLLVALTSAVAISVYVVNFTGKPVPHTTGHTTASTTQESQPHGR